MVRRRKITGWISTILVVIAATVRYGWADEHQLVAPALGNPSGSPQTTISVSDFAIRFAQLSHGLHESRINLPRHPRVTRSHRPLRQISLVGGDRFVGECLEWGSRAAAFRLQNGQVVSIPVAAISRMANSPGEVDVLVESFETGSSAEEDALLGRMLDETQAAGGKSSLRIDSSSSGYRRILDQPLAAARIEFSFQATNTDFATACGEWQIEWDGPDLEKTPLVVQIGSGRSVSLRELPISSNSASQTLKLTEGWHSFIALITPDRTRLIVDDAILASRPTPKGLLKAIHFRPADKSSKNLLWIDELQIRKTGNLDDIDPSSSESIDRDLLLNEMGDELFGRIIGVTEQAATLETLGKFRSIPLSRVIALNWYQPTVPISQSFARRAGVVARIVMQPFVDRPACEPEELTVTITAVDSKHLTVQHSLIGELKLRWSDVLRVDPLFVGQAVLIDGRRFHLGNSIRTDFHRHFPDGTQLRGEFILPDVPSGQPYISLDVAELEAAGPEAPRASPFLAELRAGNLVTDVFVNDQCLGNLNQQIRYKPSVQNPNRVRLPIPHGLLKRGQNTFQLRQQPLKKSGLEFDDAEVGNIRIDFES